MTNGILAFYLGGVYTGGIMFAGMAGISAAKGLHACAKFVEKHQNNRQPDKEWKKTALSISRWALLYLATTTAILSLIPITLGSLCFSALFFSCTPGGIFLAGAVMAGGVIGVFTVIGTMHNIGQTILRPKPRFA